MLYLKECNKSLPDGPALQAWSEGKCETVGVYSTRSDISRAAYFDRRLAQDIVIEIAKSHGSGAHIIDISLVVGIRVSSRDGSCGTLDTNDRGQCQQPSQ